MALELLKRATIAVYLRLAHRELAGIHQELAKLREVLELQLKLQALRADLSLSALKEADEIGKMREEVEAALKPGTPPAMELLQQSPEELARLAEAHAHAERRFGEGKVPGSLDLYAEARSMEPENAEEEP
jgi:hypothetical protein